MGDDPDVKDEMDMDEDEQLEDESMDEAGKENPEASEIREIRNRLETLEFNQSFWGTKIITKKSNM